MFKYIIRASLVLAALAITLLVVAIFTEDVFAVSNVAPDPADNTAGNDVHLVVSKYDGIVNGLHADPSDVVVYLPADTGTIEIYSGDPSTAWGSCHPPDSFGDADTDFLLYSYNGLDPASLNLHATYNESTLTCNTWYSIAVPASWTDYSITIGTQTFYPILVRATLSPTANVATNAFKVRTPAGGYVSYYSASTTGFALQDRVDGVTSGSTSKSNHQLKFAPDCNLSGSTPARLYWFDDDWSAVDIGGTADQFNNSFRMEVREYNVNSGANTRTWFLNWDGTHNFPGGTTGWGGSQAPGSPDRSAGIEVVEGHRYIWEWFQVNQGNGINFEIPYNSIYFEVPCITPDYDMGDSSWCSAGSGQIMGFLGNRNDGSEYLDVRIYIRIVGNAALYNQVHPANLGSPPGDNGIPGTHNYRINIPAWAMGNNDTIYTVVALLPSGNVDIVRSGNLGACDPEFAPTITASATCNAAAGTGRIFGRAGDLDGTTRVQARVEHNGVVQRLATPFNLNLNPDEAFNIVIPANMMSSQHNTIVEWVRVQDVVGPNAGSFVYASGFGNTNDNRLNLGRCGTYWNLVPQTPTGPADTATTPKPGDSLAITGRTLNVGTGQSDTFNMVLRWRYTRSDNTWSGWNRTTEQAKPATGPGSDRTINRAITLPNDARHGGRLCVQTGNNRWRGESTPPPKVVTNSGWRYSGDLCYTIFNRRFDLNDNFTPALTPNTLFPGDNINVSYTIVNNDTAERVAAYPGSVGGFAYRVNYSIALSGTGSANPTLTSHAAPNSTVGWNPTGVSGSAVVRIDPAARTGDEVCVTITAQPEYGFSINTGNLAISQAGGSVTSQTVCEKVGESPYLEVFNADVWSGGAWDPDVEGGFWCPTNTSTAFIKTVRRNNVGAFAEFAATALDRIEGFSTTLAETNLLDFRNVGGPDGYFHSSGRCVVDYFEYLSRDTSLNGVNNFSGNLDTTGQSVAVGNRSFGGATITNNQHIVVVDGDVNLNADIVYGNYNASDPSDVPFFMVVANGDINIAEGVRRLDGIYVSKGDINTCSNGVTQLATNVCVNQLEVHGMFIAQDVQFRRTYSGVVRNAGDAPRQGAELFVFSPELYIAQPPFVSNFVRNYEASQIKDLPPVYY